MLPPTPSLRRVADRSYVVLSDLDTTVQFLSLIFSYVSAGKSGDLYLHRWTHVGAGGRTMIILFRPEGDNPPRLSVLGPRLIEVDDLAVEEVAE